MIKLTILTEEDQNNVCSKCCKTIQVIDRMMEAFPDFKNKIELSYEDYESLTIINKYGRRQIPAIFINDVVFSEGHVPIIKKLTRELLEFLK